MTPMITSRSEVESSLRDFDPNVWLSDPNLRACCAETRGIWMDMLCVASKMERPGELAINGKPMTADEIARMIGESPQTVEKATRELLEKGAAEQTRDGVIYNRRMVRHAMTRRARSQSGQLGAGARWSNERVGVDIEQQARAAGGGSVQKDILRFINAWNKIAQMLGLPKCAALTSKRRAILIQRFGEGGWKQTYPDALTHIPKSSSLRGVNDRGWRANVDWFCRPDTVTKLLEGMYDDQGGDAGPKMQTGPKSKPICPRCNARTFDPMPNGPGICTPCSLHAMRTGTKDPAPTPKVEEETL